MKKTGKEVRPIGKTLLLWHTATMLRFELYSTRLLAQGSISRIGTHAAYFEIITDDEPYSESVQHSTHRHALRYLLNYLHRNMLIASLSDVETVIHRISHGGTLFSQTTLLRHDDIAKLHSIAHLSTDGAAAAIAVRAAMSQLPSRHIGVFDTACTALMPPEATSYALPPIITRKFGVRRYGYGGILHQAAYDAVVTPSIAKRARRVVSILIEKDVSVTAFLNGTACQTSGGFTQADGLPGLSRSGSVDPRIPLHLATHLRLDARQVDKLLSSKSGFAGISGKSSYDEIVAGAKRREPACIAALMLLTHTVAESAASMTAALGGIDLIIFSGEGASWLIVEDICKRLSYFGISLGKRKEGIITTPRSRVAVAVVDVSEPDALLAQARPFLPKH
jgi:acetate kinase